MQSRGGGGGGGIHKHKERSWELNKSQKGIMGWLHGCHERQQDLSFSPFFFFAEASSVRHNDEMEAARVERSNETDGKGKKWEKREGMSVVQGNRGVGEKDERKGRRGGDEAGCH